MGRYRGSRYQSYGHRSIGHEKALEHIREAEALSEELGGTDEDVKKYFFSLSYNQLQGIFKKYELQYERSAREYAEKTLSKWKSGKVHMSGMVAERLFNLLPPIMPLEAKFQLTESLWKHVGPSSKKTYYIGLDADLDEVSQQVREHLEKVVINYEISSPMEARFKWLSQGDVGIKQQLLNHFRQQEKFLQKMGGSSRVTKDIWMKTGFYLSPDVQRMSLSGHPEKISIRRSSKQNYWNPYSSRKLWSTKWISSSWLVFIRTTLI